MAETFDYVGFARDFEKRYGRPPTSEELEKGIDPLEGIVRTPTQKEVETEMARINASYKPSFGERLKTGLSFLGRNGIKAFVLLLQTPIYLTLFFFNLIKSTIGVFVIWFVSKLMIAFGLSMIVGYVYNEDLTKVPKIVSDFGQFLLGANYNFLSGTGGEPNFFPNGAVDVWIVGIAIIFLALVATFSKAET